MQAPQCPKQAHSPSATGTQFSAGILHFRVRASASSGLSRSVEHPLPNLLAFCFENINGFRFCITEEVPPRSACRNRFVYKIQTKRKYLPNKSPIRYSHSSKQRLRKEVAHESHCHYPGRGRRCRGGCPHHQKAQPLNWGSAPCSTPPMRFV